MLVQRLRRGAPYTSTLGIMNSLSSLDRKPNRWIAAVLGLLSPPLAMLYVARPGWAASYFAVLAAIAFAGIFVLRGNTGDVVAALAGLAVGIAAAVHAYRLARSYNWEMRPWFSSWYGLVGIVATFAAITFGVRAFLFEPFRIPGSSMAPAIEPRAYLVVKKWGYGDYEAYGIRLLRKKISAPIQRGDIFVFKYPEDPRLNYAKRVVGLPKDRISYRNKKLSVNDEEAPLRNVGTYEDLNTRYIQYSERLGDREYFVLLAPGTLSLAPIAKTWDGCVHSNEGISCNVPDGHYFVLGDNRDNSNDSRMWGFVPEVNLVGKVVYITR